MKAAPGEASDNAVVVTPWKEQVVRHDAGIRAEPPKSKRTNELRGSGRVGAPAQTSDTFV